MTDTYVSASIGSDTTGSGSQTNPYRTFAKVISSVTLNSGDRVFLRRGDTFTETLTLTSFTNGTGNSPITIDAYDSGNLPFIVPPTGNGISAGGAGGGGFNVRNLALRPISSAVGVSFATTAIEKTTIKYLDITGGATGIIVQPSTTGQPIPIGWEISYNNIRSAGGAGIQWVGRQYGMRISSNTVTGCGSKVAQEGIEVYTYRGTGALTWTSVGGNVYSAPIAQQAGVNVDSIHTLILVTGGSWNYVPEDAGATTAPGDFQYGFITGTQTLYVNLGGADATTLTGSFFQFGQFQNWMIDNNTVTGQIAFGGSEGNGIMCDFFCGRGTIRSNFTSGNANSGILASGPFTMIDGNICVNNGVTILGGGGGDEIAVPQYGRGSSIVNNTCVKTSGSPPACINWTGSKDTQIAVVQNNICVGGDYSLLLQSDVGTDFSSCTNNGTFRFRVAATQSHSASNSITSDPQLDAYYRPATAAYRATGVRTPGTYTYYNNEFPFKPDIGAVQTYSTRTFGSRSLAASRTFASSRDAIARAVPST